MKLLAYRTLAFATALLPCAASAHPGHDHATPAAVALHHLVIPVLVAAATGAILWRARSRKQVQRVTRRRK